jgi:hypothetical protein
MLERGISMGKLVWIIIIVSLAFVIQSVFVGGDYIRFAGERLGIGESKIDPVADLADTFRLDQWMAEKSSQSRSGEKRRLGN